MSTRVHVRSRIARLARVSPAEAVDRGRDAACRVLERCQVLLGPPHWRRQDLADALPAHGPLHDVRRALVHRRWREAHEGIAAHLVRRPVTFLVHPSLRPRLVEAVTAAYPDAPAAARTRAARHARHEYELLGHGWVWCGDRGAFDWHRDPVSGRGAPMRYWADVPYLDPACGDHKVTWELNRHQHWLALGRAWWLAGDAAARQTFVRELGSWMAANPPLAGPNWASALELAFRCLSWTWAAELFASPDAGDRDPWLVDLLLGLDRQLTHVERHLSRYFSPNTHLLGEALALYVCGQAFPELARSGRRVRTGRRILLEETTRQVLADGGHAERSPHYHRYALEFYLLALSLARVTGDRALAGALAPVAARMAAYLHHISGPDGALPLVGDDDGGELFPMGAPHHGHARAALGWAAVLLDAPQLRIDPVPESVLWLTANPRAAGGAESGTPEAMASLDPGALHRTRVFPDTGYVAARRGSSRLLIDVGPHGFLNGGHAHADALSIVATAHGHAVLVDPGTATYTMDPSVRDRMRSSLLHNTVSLGGRSQAEPDGPFHWRTTAGARLRRAVSNPAFDYVEADTDAWSPAVHERAVLFAGDDRWIVFDRVDGTAEPAAAHWHIDPAWAERRDDSGALLLEHPSGVCARLAVTGGRIQTFRGDATGLGWMAPVYGGRVPCTTVRATHDPESGPWLVTGLESGARPRRGAVTTMLAGMDAHDRTAAVVTRFGDDLEVTVCRLGPPAAPVTITLDATRGYRLTTDARVLHVRLADGRPRVLSGVDIGLLRVECAQLVTLATGATVPDLSATFDAGGPPRIASASRPGDVVLYCHAGGRAADERASARDQMNTTRMPCVELPGLPTR